MNISVIKGCGGGLAAMIVGLLLAGCSPPLALKKVVLYQNGIGYFERQGTFSGDKLRLRLRKHELNDVLKSLTVIDRKGGKRRPITAVVPKQQMRTDPKERGDDYVWLDISLGHDGDHDLVVTYSVPTPAWRATYRLVLPAKGDQALVQGWALINNKSGEDWSNVALTLATGAPMTFAIDMQTPRFVARPDLSGRMIKPVVTGAVRSESARPGDRDGDGIADEKDRCPGHPEDRDGRDDDDGCPDVDNDRDRIVDVDDKCPNEPETYNGYQDLDGCPDKGRVVVHRGRIEILDKIYFGRGSATIKPISMPILNAIAATLKGNPGIKVIEAQGHASPAEGDIWGLSARRAGAVRATLKRAGVTTEVQARAYGATRQLTTAKGEEQQSRNRRVEFRIVRRDDEGAKSPGGAVTAAAVEKSVPRGAKLATVAGMVRYRLPGSVSIQEETTTMLTVINRRTKGQEVFLYRPDANVTGSQHHPQRAAMIANSGKLTLEPGPVAIFAHGTFVGEGLISRLHPGQTAFIPYAVDSSTAVRVNSRTDEQPATFISLLDGVATVENHQQIITRYEVETGAQVPKMMVVKHPRRSGYELLNLPPATSTTATAALIPFPINPSRRSVLEVREKKPVRRSIQIIADATAFKRLELYISDTGSLKPQQVKQLEGVIAAQRRVAQLSQKTDRLRGRVSDIGMRSGELRESLKAVARTRGGAALRRRLLRQLSASVAEMDRATQALTGTSLELSEARDALTKQLSKLSIRRDKQTK